MLLGNCQNHKSKSDSSSSINLCNGTELDIESTISGENGTTPVLSLLVFSLPKINPSDIPIFLFISNLYCSLTNL